MTSHDHSEELGTFQYENNVLPEKKVPITKDRLIYVIESLYLERLS